MAANLTPRQQIRADVMRECLMALIGESKAGYGDAKKWIKPITELAPFWRQYADALADEILGKEG